MLFESVKNNITARQTAEGYGLHVTYNGMCKWLSKTKKPLTAQGFLWRTE